jgi:hypothetical protein
VLSFKLAVRLPEEVKGLNTGCFVSECDDWVDSSEEVLTVTWELATDRLIDAEEACEDPKEMLISFTSLFAATGFFAAVTSAGTEDFMEELLRLDFRLLL